METILDLMAEGGSKELQQQICFSTVGAVVKEREDDRLHETCALILLHQEYELGQVWWLGLWSQTDTHERQYIYVEPKH